MKNEEEEGFVADDKKALLQTDSTSSRKSECTSRRGDKTGCWVCAQHMRMC